MLGNLFILNPPSVSQNVPSLLFLIACSTYYCKHKTTEKKRPQFLVTLVHQADNLALPFALLEANTFLPPGVLILARKP
jgi:hypothetical protein